MRVHSPLVVAGRDTPDYLLRLLGATALAGEQQVLDVLDPIADVFNRHGWKISPSIEIDAGETFVLADIHDSGAIQHIWMTPSGHWRFAILRIYWDASPTAPFPAADRDELGIIYRPI